MYITKEAALAQVDNFQAAVYMIAWEQSAGMEIRDIGQILIKKGIVTADKVESCRQSIAGTPLSLADCLEQQGLATDVQIAQAYADLVHVNYLSQITEKMADPKLLGEFPLKFLRTHEVVPVMIDGVITIVTANPQDFQPIDELNVLLQGQAKTAISTKRVIIDAINRYYPLEGAREMIEELEEEKGAPEAIEFAEIEDKDILAMAAEAPIIKLVNHILVQAVKRGASDIHIEPFEKELRVRYRIDGIMYDVMMPPKRVQGALSSRIKIMANLNIAEKRLPQDGRIEIKVADKAYDIRVSVLPVQFGERIVMRLLDKTRSFATLDKLGFSKRDLEVVMQTIERPNGIFYVTGPTGSGKTTTLYAILSTLNKPGVNIVTVEDPVEYQMSGIGQVQVKDTIGLSFAAALRSILRQDPDIIMIGETRDQQTAQIAIQAALTGHFVLSTLHTNDAPSAITRLIDMGVEPFLIASSIVAVMAQRLVRRLCDDCKVAYTPDAETLKKIGLAPASAKGITFYKPEGCAECNQTGYKGRIAIFEIMQMTSDIAKLTVERADSSLIRKQAIHDGMTLLLQDGVRKIKEGITTIEEVLRVATIDEENTVVEL
ncbi:MAG: type II secretion system ATPase GspE [Candidatus Babeliales bacterium]